jgi:hypothetical protein
MGDVTNLADRRKSDPQETATVEYLVKLLHWAPDPDDWSQETKDQISDAIMGVEIVAGRRKKGPGPTGGEKVQRLLDILEERPVKDWDYDFADKLRDTLTDVNLLTCPPDETRFRLMDLYEAELAERGETKPTAEIRDFP